MSLLDPLRAYTRGPKEGYEIIDDEELEIGFGWIADPSEDSIRSCYVTKGEDGYYFIDPLHSKGIFEEIRERTDGEEFAGIIIGSTPHRRDAGMFAEEFDCPVYIPEDIDLWVPEPDAEIKYVETGEEFGKSGWFLEKVATPAPKFQGIVIRFLPVPNWQDSLLWHEDEKLMFTGDLVAKRCAVMDECVGLFIAARLEKPTWLLDYEPEGIISGHDDGVFENATEELRSAVHKGKHRFPIALSNLRWRLRMFIGACFYDDVDNL